MDDVLRKTLLAIGLSDKEVLVLALLLYKSPLRANAIAKELRFNRTTAYWVLGELTDKGLVSSTKKGSATTYQSVPARMLPGYIERRREALKATRDQLEALVPQLEAARNPTKALPKVQYFEGTDGVMAVYDDHLATSNYEMLGFADIDEISKFLPLSYFTKYTQEKDKKRITTRGIFADNPTAHRYETEAYKDADPKAKPNVRYLPPEQFPFKGEITMYGKDKVSIIQLYGESSNAIVITDAAYYGMMRTIFELCWRGIT